MVNKNIRDSKYLNALFECTFINLTTAQDVSDIGTGGISKVFSAVGIWQEVIQSYSKHNFDLVYLTLSPHGPAFYKDGILAILLKLKGARIVYHMHGKGIAQIARKSRLKRQMYQWVFRKAKVIHLASGLYRDIEDFVPKEDVWIVPNGIPGPETDKTQRNNHEKILYLSNMQESKGSMDLLKAAGILKERRVSFKIDFVGKWHNDPQFQMNWQDYLSKHGLEDFVAYHGAKYGHEKEVFLEQAGIFALPTYYKNECFPISILEAMSYGLAVVSTDEGAISEIVIDGKTGYIVPGKNPEALADSLEKLLTDKARTVNMGEAAKGVFEKKYTLQVFEKTLGAALNEIILQNNTQKNI